jgi:hypothetical protein
MTKEVEGSTTEGGAERKGEKKEKRGVVSCKKNGKGRTHAKEKRKNGGGE